MTWHQLLSKKNLCQLKVCNNTTCTDLGLYIVTNRLSPTNLKTSIPCSDENAFLLMLDMRINFGVWSIKQLPSVDDLIFLTSCLLYHALIMWGEILHWLLSGVIKLIIHTYILGCVHSSKKHWNKKISIKEALTKRQSVFEWSSLEKQLNTFYIIEI